VSNLHPGISPGPQADDTRPRILVVEDDVELASMLEELLVEEGYQVDLARDGQRGLHLGLANRHEVLVIDRGLPAIEGVELIGRLRRQGISTPVLILTARGTVRDRIEGLDAGAEDYLVKPFDVDELLARLRALRRRHREEADALPLGTRSLVVAERRVVGIGRDDVELSPRECDLLQVLARRPHQVFTREDLLEEVFGDADTTGSVDTYVHYLRKKLGRDVVRTVRGTGYRLGSA
jgi:two-component system, OmpR family, response regulator QseB